MDPPQDPGEAGVIVGRTCVLGDHGRVIHCSPQPASTLPPKRPLLRKEDNEASFSLLGG